MVSLEAGVTGPAQTTAHSPSLPFENRVATLGIR